ncbi:CCA tRNA nucleotidyltransferase [Lentilactobacillus curieae]|uniref:CCA-adding enzyme n=1 Tax=Lentilactobacillus curieae TaxID=1138822 RepID=A0A1S6QKH7_9LACO|nr:CCA tRNA nucleotidyltransferase [Lentilactobacillus curieae]
MAIILKITNFPIEFEQALPILRSIEAAGFEAYFVGGSVRDTIMGRKIHDVDIATSAYPEEVKKIFNRTVDTGIQHGTVMVLDHGNGYEVTTFRTESTYQDYRRPDEVTFVRSLKEDLKRRDFTINALALSEDGQVTDLFSGLDDMEHKLIRAVGEAEERFNEDALRMMRAIRFSSQLDFDIEPATEDAIHGHAYLLEKIAIERIHEEFVKMMLGTRPNLGLEKMIETKLTDYVPGFKAEHLALKKLLALDLTPESEIEVWTIFAYVFGYNQSTTTKFMREWKSSNQLTEEVARATELLTKVTANKVDNLALYQAGEVAVIAADHVAQIFGLDVETKVLINQYSKLQIKSKKDLALSAKNLLMENVYQPGPELGKVLQYLEENVVNNNLNNTYDDLLASAKALKEEGSN